MTEFLQHFFHTSSKFCTFAARNIKIEMTRTIRIKDIAERAGVSVGTVDRVLHERPNVSQLAREKVEKALKELN